MPLMLGYLLDIFSIQIMVSTVPTGTLFSSLVCFLFSWFGNYIWDNLGLDYKIDVGSIFSPYYTVIILCSLHDRIYRCILESSPLAISANRPLNLVRRKCGEGEIIEMEILSAWWLQISVKSPFVFILSY